jgi:hypothetical protein
LSMNGAAWQPLRRARDRGFTSSFETAALRPPQRLKSSQQNWAFLPPSLRGANGSGLGRPDDKLRDEAIQFLALDCFAEPVIGRAFARPVGSQ